MSKPELYQILDSIREIELTIKGRKSGNDLSGPVWFVREGNILYLLPVNGSDTNWYKNMLANPMLKLSINSKEILSAKGRPITDKNRVADVVRKFESRYSEGEVKKYYTKFDAAVEVPLWQAGTRNLNNKRVHAQIGKKVEALEIVEILRDNSRLYTWSSGYGSIKKIESGSFIVYHRN